MNRIWLVFSILFFGFSVLYITKSDYNKAFDAFYCGVMNLIIYGLKRELDNKGKTVTIKFRD